MYEAPLHVMMYEAPLHVMMYEDQLQNSSYDSKRDFPSICHYAMNG